MARKESITLVLKNKLQKEYTLDNMIEYISVLLENNSRLTMFKTDDIEIVSRFLINESKYIIDDGKINRKRADWVMSFVGFFSSKLLSNKNMDKWIDFKIKNPRTTWNTYIFKQICLEDYEYYLNILKNKYVTTHKNNYKKLTDEEKKERKINNKRTLEYWLNRGYDSETARRMQSEYQKKNSGVFEDYWIEQGMSNPLEKVMSFDRTPFKYMDASDRAKSINSRLQTVSTNYRNMDFKNYMKRRSPSIYKQLKLYIPNIDNVLDEIDKEFRFNKQKINRFLSSVVKASYTSISALTLFRYIAQNRFYDDICPLLHMVYTNKRNSISEFKIYKEYKDRSYFKDYVIKHKGHIEYSLIVWFFKSDLPKNNNIFYKARSSYRNKLNSKSKCRGEASYESLKNLFIPLYKILRKKGMSRDDVSWGIFGSKEFRIYLDKRGHYRYDFTIHSKKIIIEYDGWCHFSDVYGNVSGRDKHKELKAVENGYHLYRFSYLNDPQQFIKEIIEIIGEFDEN